MKRCPECRRDYYDDSLVYCLDDGNTLLEGPGMGELPIAMMPPDEDPREQRTRRFEHPAGRNKADLQPDNGNPAPSRSVSRRIGLLAAVGGILLLTLLGIESYWLYTSDGGSAKQIESIAVMPFVNESGNAEMEYLSDGMTETLISSLSQLPDLNIKARSSVFRYKGQEFNAGKIGRELGVEALITGKVAQRPATLSLYIELIHAASEKVIWSKTYDRPITNLVSLQREIARDASRNLHSKLTGNDEERISKTLTESSEAYDLYLQGRFHWNKRTGEGITKSVGYFQQAISVDPTYALAFAGLADAYSVIPSYVNGSPDEYFPKSKAAAQRALELDETLAEAHTALARVMFAYEWDFSGSDREYRRAIELNPNYATAHHWYGNANLLRTGRFGEAVSEMERARAIDPFSLIINADLGETYLLAGRYDEAIEQLRKTIEMDDRFAYPHWWLGVAYQRKGRLADAMAAYERSKKLNDTPWVGALIAQAYAVSGNRSKALELLARMDEISNSVYVPRYDFAIVYAAIGDKDKAFEALEQSFRNRDQRLTRLKVDGFLDALRSDPRFPRLVKKVGLPE